MQKAIADDMTILDFHTTQDKITEEFQVALKNIHQWTKNLKIKRNGTKSTRVTYTLHYKNNDHTNFLSCNAIQMQSQQNTWATPR